MLIDTLVDVDHIDTAGEQAARAERTGYAGIGVAETRHDAFLPLAVAAGRTEDIELSTAIAIAFARNPMTLAHVGYDLQQLSRGRFVLGLGSQIRPHITKRFSMPWTRPAARMRELVLALRHIWGCWHEGRPLEFRGDFYTHTLMTPMFSPRPHPYGPPRVRLAAVGPTMTEVAGEVADGMICHPLTSPDYLREATMPALERGAARAGRDASAVELAGMVLVGVGDSERELAERADAVRRQIAFYASTPSYRPVLELHGWGPLQDELHGMSKAGQWSRMGELITDEILQTFAVIGPTRDVADQLEARFGGLLHRVQLSAPYPLPDGALDGVVHDAVPAGSGR